MSSVTTTGTRRGYAVWWLIAAALLVRLLVFPLSQNKHSDAPMRALIAERMNLDAQAARDPASYCQYGPLHLAAMRPFLAVDPDARRSSRYLSVIVGVLAIPVLLSLGRRMAGGPAAWVAAGAMALSPLHVQLSTTAGSEALYILLLVAALDRLLEGFEKERLRWFAVAGLLASLAAVTRYDAWIALPVTGLAALVMAWGYRRKTIGVVLFGVLTASLPLLWILWNWKATGHPMGFAEHIANEHKSLAGELAGRHGIWAVRYRQLAVWIPAFGAAMTPLLFLAVFLRPRTKLSPATRLVLVTAMAPVTIYLGRGLLLGQFEPLTRFALTPGLLLLPMAAANVLQRPRLRWVANPAVIAAVAVLWSGWVYAKSWSLPGRGWGGLESMGAVTRLDPDDLELARYLRANRKPDERVLLDTFGFNDIMITAEANIPALRAANLSNARDPGPSLRDFVKQTWVTWVAIHDSSWAPKYMHEMPRERLRFGGWTLARFDRSE